MCSYPSHHALWAGQTQFFLWLKKIQLQTHLPICFFFSSVCNMSCTNVTSPFLWIFKLLESPLAPKESIQKCRAQGAAQSPNAPLGSMSEVYPPGSQLASHSSSNYETHPIHFIHIHFLPLLTIMVGKSTKQRQESTLNGGALEQREQQQQWSAGASNVRLISS
jgi:hypothetical protein